MTNRDAAGRQIHTGSVYKKWEESFGLGSALPSWLQAGAGTASFSGVGTGAGWASITSGAALDNEASLQTVATFDTTFCTEIAVTVGGLFFSRDGDIEPSLRLDGGSAGVALTQNKTEATASIRFYRAAGTVFVPTNYPLRGGGRASAKRSLTLRCKFLTGEVFVEEGGEVMAYAKTGLVISGVTVPPIVRGQVRPLVKTISRLASAASVNVPQFAVETWSD